MRFSSLGRISGDSRDEPADFILDQPVSVAHT